MEFNQNQIRYIQETFHQLDTQDGFVALMNKVKQWLWKVSPNKPFVAFELNDLTYYAYQNKYRYQTFTIPKKTGEPRIIYTPVRGLKTIQKCLNALFSAIFTPHKAAHGFVLHKSVVTNAQIHVHQNYVYNIDLKDFFLSIDQARIWACLKNPPFKLPENMANLIAALCCEEIEVERLHEKGVWETLPKRVLPQGAPTSPLLSNVVCQRLDFKLSQLAKKFNLKYSRYADDITFSSMQHVYQAENPFIKRLHEIIQEQHFHINIHKVRLQIKEYHRQEVTGLIVNEKVNIKRTYVKDLRKWLYLWERYGEDKVNALFQVDYVEKKMIIKGKPHFIHVLGGKLEYLKMVLGCQNDRFKLLNERFVKLIEPSETRKVETKPPIKEKNLPKEIDLSKHKPKDVSDFLKLFREEPLKWLTHTFDSAEEIFNLEQKLVEISTTFKQKAQEFTIPSSLYVRINVFIGNDSNQEWYIKNKKYGFNWRSDKIKEWCLKHPTKHPLSDEDFEKAILIFKESIQIRQNLKSFIREIITEKLSSDYSRYTIEYDENLKSADFYTDTEKLRVGLGYIFAAIRQRGFEHTRIKIKWETRRGRRKLSIVHIDSPLTKALNRDMLGGDLLEAEKNFYQICDWSILANRPNGESNKLNILFSVSEDSNTSPQEILITEIEGFTHELIFYI